MCKDYGVNALYIMRFWCLPDRCLLVGAKVEDDGSFC